MDVGLLCKKADLLLGESLPHAKGCSEKVDDCPDRANGVAGRGDVRGEGAGHVANAMARYFATGCQEVRDEDAEKRHDVDDAELGGLGFGKKQRTKLLLTTTGTAAKDSSHNS